MAYNGAPVTVTNFAQATGSTAAAPSYERSVGSDNLATGQNPSAANSGAAVQVVPARSARRSVTISNITGTQPVFLGGSAVTPTTGLFLAGTPGASVTLAFTGALFATSTGAAQTLSYAETY